MSATRILSRLDQHDINGPQAAVDALDLRERLGHAAVANPLSALIADMQAGRVTAAQLDKRLEQVAVKVAKRDAAKALLADVDSAIEGQALRAIALEDDRITAELRPAFDAAAEAIARRFAICGTANFEQVRTAGPDALVAYSNAEVAKQQIAEIRRLISDVRVGMIEQPSWWCATPDDVTRAATIPARAPEHIASNGLSVRLNLVAEAQRLDAGIANAAHQAEAVALEQAKVHAADNPMTRALHDVANEARLAASKR
jgi:hypothetical protein